MEQEDAIQPRKYRHPTRSRNRRRRISVVGGPAWLNCRIFCENGAAVLPGRVDEGTSSVDGRRWLTSRNPYLGLGKRRRTRLIWRDFVNDERTRLTAGSEVKLPRNHGGTRISAISRMTWRNCGAGRRHHNLRLSRRRLVEIQENQGLRGGVPARAQDPEGTQWSLGRRVRANGSITAAITDVDNHSNRWTVAVVSRLQNIIEAIKVRAPLAPTVGPAMLSEIIWIPEIRWRKPKDRAVSR